MSLKVYSDRYYRQASKSQAVKAIQIKVNRFKKLPI